MVSSVRTRSFGVVAILACVAAGLFMYANPATSQSGPDEECSGDVVATLVTTGFGDRTNKIYSFSNDNFMLTEFTVEIPPMQAGTYDVNAVSYDGYTGRAAVEAQPDESWVARLLDADGNVLASSSATPDLADGVEEVTWAGGVGSITWSGAEAVGLQFLHASPGGSIPNSVSPSCVGFTENTPVQPKAICVPDPTLDVDDQECADTPGDPDGPTTAAEPPTDKPVITIAQVPDPLPTAPAFTG